MSFFGQFLDTIGVEYESTSMTTDDIRDLLAKKLSPILGNFASNIRTTRDASTEFFAERIKSGQSYIRISTHTPLANKLSGMGSGNQEVMGFEVYTNPMEIPELERLLYPFMFMLQNAGDFTSQRAAVHFHVGFANNLRLLKNLLRISLMLDPVLYRLGGMGGTFRGAVNAAAYARPLLNSAVVAVGRRLSLSMTPQEAEEVINQQKTNRNKFVQIINPMAALEATNIADFWASFGVSYTGDNHKYHPCRYSGTNFFAVSAHGTIEFRHFNQCMDAPLIIAIAKFLRSTVELSASLGKNEAHQFEIIDSNKEISVGDAEEVVRKLVSLSFSKEIDNIPTESEVALILDTIAKSHFVPLPELPVKTHIRDFSVDHKLVEAGKLKYVEEFSEPKHVDIHNISGKEVSIFS